MYEIFDTCICQTKKSLTGVFMLFFRRRRRQTYWGVPVIDQLNTPASLIPKYDMIKQVLGNLSKFQEILANSTKFNKFQQILAKSWKFQQGLFQWISKFLKTLANSWKFQQILANSSKSQQILANVNILDPDKDDPSGVTACQLLIWLVPLHHRYLGVEYISNIYFFLFYIRYITYMHICKQALFESMIVI